MSELSSKQRRQLKGLAHGLSISVQVGNAGITDGVTESVHHALAAHELIKVKVGQGSELDRKAGAAELAKATGSQVAAVIGRVWVLYRADLEDPKISLV
jgi:RNA-binding protein